MATKPKQPELLEESMTKLQKNLMAEQEARLREEEEDKELEFQKDPTLSEFENEDIYRDKLKRYLARFESRASLERTWMREHGLHTDMQKKMRIQHHLHRGKNGDTGTIYTMNAWRRQKETAQPNGPASERHARREFLKNPTAQEAERLREKKDRRLHGAATEEDKSSVRSRPQSASLVRDSSMVEQSSIARPTTAGASRLLPGRSLPPDVPYEFVKFDIFTERFPSNASGFRTSVPDYGINAGPAAVRQRERMQKQREDLKRAAKKRLVDQKVSNAGLAALQHRHRTDQLLRLMADIKKQDKANAKHIDKQRAEELKRRTDLKIKGRERKIKLTEEELRKQAEAARPKSAAGRIGGGVSRLLGSMGFERTAAALANRVEAHTQEEEQLAARRGVRPPGEGPEDREAGEGEGGSEKGSEVRPGDTSVDGTSIAESDAGSLLPTFDEDPEAAMERARRKTKKRKKRITERIVMQAMVAQSAAEDMVAPKHYYDKEEFITAAADGLMAVCLAALDQRIPKGKKIDPVDVNDRNEEGVTALYACMMALLVKDDKRKKQKEFKKKKRAERQWKLENGLLSEEETAQHLEEELAEKTGDGQSMCEESVPEADVVGLTADDMMKSKTSTPHALGGTVGVIHGLMKKAPDPEEMGPQFNGLLEVLAERGADMGTFQRGPEQNRWNLLHHAASRGNVKRCIWLIQKGCPKDAVTSDGQTPLMLATLLGDIPTVLNLLMLEVSLDIQDRHGATALHHAAATGRSKLCKMLLLAGAKKQCFDKDGKTPVDYAIDHKHRVTTDVLRVFKPVQIAPREYLRYAELQVHAEGEAAAEFAAKLAAADAEVETKKTKKKKKKRRPVD